MKTVSTVQTFLKDTYFEYVYLASYYRWSASKSSPATGSRSQINGKPYTINSARAYHEAARRGELAISRQFLKEAAKTRLEIQKIADKQNQFNH